MRTHSIVFFAFLLAGCGTKPAPPAQLPTEPPPATPQAQAGAVAPVAPPVPQPNAAPSVPPPSLQAPAVAAQPPIAAAEPAGPPPAPPPTPSTDQAQAKSAPAAKAAPKAPSAPAPAAQAPKPATAPSETAKPQAPAPLDLTSLETRLKETKAIGVMTKISLKNQVDDLLDQFREFYAGKLKTTLPELRRPYDLLVLKVLSLLQDSDPSLATAIAASREAIWGILSDPAKFAKI
jgi:hypothetical protein